MDRTRLHLRPDDGVAGRTRESVLLSAAAGAALTCARSRTSRPACRPNQHRTREARGEIRGCTRLWSVHEITRRRTTSQTLDCFDNTAQTPTSSSSVDCVCVESHGPNITAVPPSTNSTSTVIRKHVGGTCESNGVARGVSPVVAVVLLVAVTVVIAGTVGAFVFVLGDTSEPPPTVSLTSEQTEAFVVATGGLNRSFTAVTITHRGGDSIRHDRLEVLVNGEPAYGVNASDDPCAAAGPNGWVTGANCARTLWNDSETVTAGDSITVVHKNSSATADGVGYTAPDQDVFPSVPDDVDGSLYVQNRDPFFAGVDGTAIQLTTGDTIKVVWTRESDDGGVVLLEYTVT
ncbi:type IV pilin [Halobaculum sp. MBLA0147]|uniref:type IV pilin n=1 Tax=Halobaculum sp. MBLA0147 TaxID=3079934 RepID=UPI0035233820